MAVHLRRLERFTHAVFRSVLIEVKAAFGQARPVFPQNMTAHYI